MLIERNVATLQNEAVTDKKNKENTDLTNPCIQNSRQIT